jgi:DNA-directed RNA polymerase specialized sigma24 family protein
VVPAADFHAFEALHADLLRLARVLLRGSRVRTSPEDLVQGVLTRILAALRAGTLRADAIESPRSFAYASLRNLFLDEVKAHRTRFEESLEEATEAGAPPPARAAGGPSLLVKQVLGRFEPKERCFLLRVVFEERSVTEAQTLCGWPPLSPYYQLRLLLDRAREML